MRPKTSRKARLRRWERFLSLASEAGAIAMNLRDRPTRLDWLGVGLRTVGLAMKIRGEHREATARNPWDYFDESGLDAQWVQVPSEFKRLVMEHTHEVTIDEDWWDGGEDSARVCLGKVGGEVVGWVCDRDSLCDGPYVRRDRADLTYRALGERIWRQVGGRHCVFGSGGLVLDPLDAGAIVPTAQMLALETRLGRFVDEGVSRSLMLVGPPGTGKSMAIRWLTRRLGVSSVRVDLAVLAGFHGRHDQSSVSTTLETLLKLLRPEALILDDLDRVDVGGPVLAFLELAVRTCRIVLASANGLGKMIGASLRPGRFDEVVRVDRLDPAVLRTLLAPDEDLYDRLAPLPAAYVAEFLKRRRVLGRDAAVAEIEELEARREMIADATEREDDR
jgi:hypothetical protein